MSFKSDITESFFFDPSATQQNINDFLLETKSTLISITETSIDPLPRITLKFPIESQQLIHSILK
jgi:hypothetical protein